LDDLLKVKVRNYNLIGDDNKQIGVVAQELEETGTTTKSVKYSVFVPMLIKAMQELKAEIETLKAQING
jgi:chemotaxis receptor (MCP) glutamine deamidase CheD